MIFRHYTSENLLPKILKDGYLKARQNADKKDFNCISLEEYHQNDYIFQCFINQHTHNKEI